MNNANKWYHYPGLGAAWLASMALGLFLLFTIRTTCRMLLFPMAASGWQGSRWVNVLDKALIILMGLVFLGFIVFMEEYFVNGLRQNRLFPRVCRIFGLELIVVFGTTLPVLSGNGLSNLVGFPLLLCAVGLGGGIVFLLLSSPNRKAAN